MQNQKIRIRLKAFDYRLIDQSAAEIVDTAKRWPLVAAPLRRLPHPHHARLLAAPAPPHWTAPHIASRTHLRLMDIVDPTDKTVDALMKLDLPAGVDVEIKLQ